MINLNIPIIWRLIFTTNIYIKGVIKKSSSQKKNVIVEPKVAKCQFDPPPGPPNTHTPPLKTKI